MEMMNKRTESMFLQLCAVVLIFAPMAKAEILVFTDQAEFEMAAMMASLSLSFDTMAKQGTIAKGELK